MRESAGLGLLLIDQHDVGIKHFALIRKVSHTAIAFSGSGDGKQTDTVSTLVSGEVAVFYFAQLSAETVGNGNINLISLLH